MTAQLERVTFSTPRDAEYVQLRPLQSLTGMPSSRFGDVVIKELLDNALDACEAAGVAPQVNVAVVAASEDGSVDGLMVADNGAGIDAALVDELCDFRTSTSDKAAYVSPARGAQGNAWSTIIGIPYALGVRPGFVKIIARGVCHTVAPDLELGHNLVIRHEREPSDQQEGTMVVVPLPGGCLPDVAGWVQSYAAVNPHATFIIEHPDRSDGQGAEIYKATAQDGWRKRLPTDKTSPWWYSETALRRLISAHIAAGADKPLGGFIREFDGLSSTAKARGIAAGLPGIATLAGFTGRPGDVGKLLRDMRGSGRRRGSGPLSVPVPVGEALSTPGRTAGCARLPASVTMPAPGRNSRPCTGGERGEHC